MFWTILVAIYLLIDLYAYQAFKSFARGNLLYIVYLLLSVIVIGNLIFQFNFAKDSSWGGGRGFAMGFFLAMLSLKTILVLFLFGEDLARIFVGGYRKLFGPEKEFDLPSRRKFVNQVALGLAAIPFSSLLYGMHKGRYNYKVFTHTLYFEDLPEAFDGYRISQISDIHSGSFKTREEVEYGLNMLNDQKSDVVLFTGDLVNNTSREMKEWKDLFGGIKAKDGVYSVLGNHDYGDYYRWDSEEEKRANMEEMKNVQAEMGWDLLLNENRVIERGDDRIALVGVENWGLGFKQAGDLQQASEGLDEKDFKVLLSHDPTHWQAEVKKDPKFFHLTLSGHTHGMQFGIEIPGWFRWSPAKLRYKNWAGMYEEYGRYLNVNRGFGYIGYPGRVGIWPEITVIELRKGSRPV